MMKSKCHTNAQIVKFHVWCKYVSTQNDIFVQEFGIQISHPAILFRDICKKTENDKMYLLFCMAQNVFLMKKTPGIDVSEQVDNICTKTF